MNKIYVLVLELEHWEGHASPVRRPVEMRLFSLNELRAALEHAVDNVAPNREITVGRWREA